MRISYYNIGCKVNFADISEIQEQFEKLGNETVEFGSPADAVIINTCTVTKNADADCRKIIRRALRQNPGAFIAVAGCYSQLKQDEISAIEGVDAIFGTKEKFLIPNIIGKFQKTGKPTVYVSDMNDAEYHSSSSADNQSHTRIVLKIQDGCDYVCTYCAVPFARGKSRSMPFLPLRKKIEELSNSNYKEVILSGINLGEYYAATGEKFADVLRLIEALNTPLRFRISSIEPNLVTNKIITIVKNSEKICPHFHIPLQSGSGKILRLMKRRYKAITFGELILKIRREMPHCCIGADVITGFPGETEEDFIETYNLLSELPVSYLHVFTYSPRDITESSKFTDSVPHNIKKERTKQLRILSDKKKQDFYRSQIGKTVTVIPEEYHDGTGINRGWSENYIKVEFSVQHPSSELVKVQLTHTEREIAYGNIMKQ